MTVQQISGLIESLEFASHQLLSDAACLRRSHMINSGRWDEPTAHQEHQACLFHAWRLKCHATEIVATLQRKVTTATEEN